MNPPAGVARGVFRRVWRGAEERPLRAHPLEHRAPSWVQVAANQRRIEMLRFARAATPLALALVIAGCNKNQNVSEATNSTVADTGNFASDTGNSLGNAAGDVKE